MVGVNLKVPALPFLAEVRAKRVEPIGLVYLWPDTG